MPDFPGATEFGKKIAKQKFYDHADVPASLRGMFVEEIESIVWRNKFSADTLNIAPGEVCEIELLHLVLRQESCSAAILETIARAIPYHLIFMLEFSGRFQLRLWHRPANGRPMWRQTAWLPFDDLPLAVQGLNMDAVYENFARQIAALPESGSLDEDLALAQAKAALQKRIAALARKVNTEKQFNRRAEYNRELRRLKADLASLEQGGTHAKDEM